MIEVLRLRFFCHLCQLGLHSLLFTLLDAFKILLFLLLSLQRLHMEPVCYWQTTCLYELVSLIDFVDLLTSLANELLWAQLKNFLLILIALIAQCLFLLLILLIPFDKIVDGTAQTLWRLVNRWSERKTVLCVQDWLHLLYDFRSVLNELLTQYLSFGVLGKLFARLSIAVFLSWNERWCLIDLWFLFHGSFQQT